MSPGQSISHHVQMSRDVAWEQGDAFAVRPLEEYSLMVQRS